MTLRLFLLALFSLTSFYCHSQTYEAGETYFGHLDYIEYKAGNLPIIISAPHGGNLEPNSIPDRDCGGCVYVQDANTQDLIRDMYDAIVSLFGCYPHVIINRLHRRKLDANREIVEAADGDPNSEDAWEDFQGFIEAAKDSVENRFTKGLYIDLHGHGHDIQRLELGYRLTKSELQLDDSELDQAIFVNDCSIKNLILENNMQLELSEMIRGADSFGQLFEEQNYPAVPSENDPYPGNGESYFSGGYNTERHGSKVSGGIDAIQIECNREGVRDTDSNRKDFAESTALVLKEFLEKHYFITDFLDEGCVLTSIENPEPINHNLVEIYPNPVLDFLFIDGMNESMEPIRLSVFDTTGQELINKEVDSVSKCMLDFSEYLPGIYLIKLESRNSINIMKVIK